MKYNDYIEPSRLYRWEGFHVLMLLFLVHILSGCAANSTRLVIQSQEAATVELKGYDGLAEQSLFKGSLSLGENKIEITYRGLALLVFSGGQTYPVIIGDKPFSLNIKAPSEPPAFTGSEANRYFYDVLAGTVKDTESPPEEFAGLMIQAKELLESTQSIRTMDELAAKKKEFHDFVQNNYDKLKQSDMVRRLLGQYFMMHEYVSYHVEGAPATDIRVKYQQAVLDGVGSWLEILQPQIPEHLVLNYCASLYFQRSMVALASLITTQFREFAYCPGETKDAWPFSDELTLTDSASGTEKQLGEINGNITITFVSEDCPVSMIQTVMKARQIADQENQEKLIVAPLEELSESHLGMNKMVIGGNMMFVNDEGWRLENMAEKIRLPLFVEVRDTDSPKAD
jgi:hypothetical protein